MRIEGTRCVLYQSKMNDTFLLTDTDNFLMIEEMIESLQNKL